MDKISILKEIINKSKRIVFFTGAGVSTESNIPDFRSKSGIFSKVSGVEPEVMLSRPYFKEHPKQFYKFYREHLVYPDALPNDAHKIIARLEEKGLVGAVVTQNVDNLHQTAGSKNVIELHGNVYRNRCSTCHKEYPFDYVYNHKDVPLCDCGGIIEPDVILYGDPLDDNVIEKAINEISHCDTLIISGTSLAVYPAARMVRYFLGNNLVIINREKTNMDDVADLVIHDYVGNVLNQIEL